MNNSDRCQYLSLQFYSQHLERETFELRVEFYEQVRVNNMVIMFSQNAKLFLVLQVC